MQFIVKLLLSNMVIILCVLLGKKHPSLAGLVATMPLTSLIVLLWLYSESRTDDGFLPGYVGGVFFGVIPTMLFFGAAWLCLKRGLHLPAALAAGFVAWIAAAALHQLLLR